MTEWLPYPGERLYKKSGNHYVIVPNDRVSGVPISCPLCTALMRSRDDDIAYESFECCHACAMTWAHPRRKAWAEGWRPSAEQIAASVVERPGMLLNFEVD